MSNFNPSPNIGTEGDAVPINPAVVGGKDGSGNTKTALFDASGFLKVNVAAGSISVSGADGAIQDGANNTIKATVLDLTDSNPIATAIVDANGDQISSFGGGTQYTEGDTDASITGTAMLMEVGSNTLQPVQGTVADGVLVNLGSNNDVTVAGVSTAAKQDTGNTSLASIDGKITAVNTGAVVISSSALPSGAATSAKQDTMIGHVDGIEGLLTTIDVDTGNVSTKIDTLAGAVSGSEMQVDVVTSALPSGAATSAKQDTGNTSLDSIDTKTPALGQALAAASVPVVLPAAQITTLTPPAAITGFATETTLGTRLSESDFDTKTGSLTESAPASDTASSGLNGRLQRIAQRLTSLITALGSPFQAGGSIGNTSFASTVADGANVTLGAKADAKSTATDTTAVSVMSVLKQISASAQAPPSQAVTNAGTFATQAAGDVASGSSDTGNPVKIGGVGKTANPTAVSDGQRVNALFDKLGKQVVVGAIRDLKGKQQTTITSSTSETTIVTAVASTFLDLYGLIITNTSATVTKVTIKDDTAGATLCVIEVPATETRGFMLPVDSAIPQAVVNKPWTATCGTSVSAIEITALFVKNT